MSLVLYGIANCDKVKLARKWLDDHGLAYRFHDFRADSLSIDLVQHWVDQRGMDALLNKRSTTWRQLTPEQQAADQTGLITLILQFPTLIKRPVLDDGRQIRLGFSATQYADLL